MRNYVFVFNLILEKDISNIEMYTWVGLVVQELAHVEFVHYWKYDYRFTNPIVILFFSFFERTTAGEAPTVSNLLNQKEPTVQKR